MTPIRVGVSFETPGVATLQTAEQRIGSLNQRLANLSITSANASRVMRTLANDMSMLANQRLDRITKGIDVMRVGMSSLLTTIERLSRYGLYSFIGAIGATGYAMKKFSSDFISINEQFAGLEITLKSAYNSVRVARELRNEIAAITMRSPLPFADIAEAARGLSLIPFARSQIIQSSVAPGGVSAQDSFFNRAVRLIEQMTTFRPDKTAQDAIFSIREAMTGEFRSLIRRFDIPISMLTSASGRTYNELKKDPSLAFEALTKSFGKVISPQAVQEIIRQPSKLFQNIKETIYQMPQLFIGDEGFYKKFVDFFVNIYEKATNFVNTGLKPLTKKLSDAMGSIFDDTVEFLGKGLEAILDKAGFGVAARPGMDAFQRTFMAISSLMEGIAKRMPELLDRLGQFFNNLWPVLSKIGEFITNLTQLLTKGLASSPLSTIGTIAGASTLYSMLPMLLTSGMGGFGRAISASGFSGRYAASAYNPLLAKYGGLATQRTMPEYVSGARGRAILRPEGYYLDVTDRKALQAELKAAGYNLSFSNRLFADPLKGANPGLLSALGVSTLIGSAAASGLGRPGTAGLGAALAGGVPITAVPVTGRERLGSLWGTAKGFIGTTVAGTLTAGITGATIAGISYAIYEAVNYFGRKVQETADSFVKTLKVDTTRSSLTTSTDIGNLAGAFDAKYIDKTYALPLVDLERVGRSRKSIYGTGVADFTTPMRVLDQMDQQIVSVGDFYRNMKSVEDDLNEAQSGLIEKQKNPDFVFKYRGTVINTAKEINELTTRIDWLQRSLTVQEGYFSKLNASYKRLTGKNGKDGIGIETEFSKKIGKLGKEIDDYLKVKTPFVDQIGSFGEGVRQVYDHVNALTKESSTLVASLDAFNKQLEEQVNPAKITNDYINKLRESVAQNTLTSEQTAQFFNVKQWQSELDRIGKLRKELFEQIVDMPLGPELDAAYRRLGELNKATRNVYEGRYGSERLREVQETARKNITENQLSATRGIIKEAFQSVQNIGAADSQRQFSRYRTAFLEQTKQFSELSAEQGFKELDVFAKINSIMKTIPDFLDESTLTDKLATVKVESLTALEELGKALDSSINNAISANIKKYGAQFALLATPDMESLTKLKDELSNVITIYGDIVAKGIEQQRTVALKAKTEFAASIYGSVLSGGLRSGSRLGAYAFSNSAFNNPAAYFGFTGAEADFFNKGTYRPNANILMNDLKGGRPVSSSIARNQELIRAFTSYESRLNQQISLTENEITGAELRNADPGTIAALTTKLYEQQTALVKVKTAIDDFNDSLDELVGRQGGPVKTFAEGFTSVVDDWYNKMDDFTAIGIEMANTLKTSFGSAFTSFVTGAQSAEEAFANFGRTLVETAINMLAQQAVMQIFGGIFGGLGWVGGAGARAASGFAVGNANPGGSWGVGRAAGGYVWGDSVYGDRVGIRANAGEYVINRDAAAKLGMSNLNALNAGQLPQGNQNFNVTINIQGGGGNRESNEQLAQQVRLAIRNEIMNARRQGGMLA